jgi:hypothetical protein
MFVAVFTGFCPKSSVCSATLLVLGNGLWGYIFEMVQKNSELRLS